MNYILSIFSYRLLNDEINKIITGQNNIIKLNYDEVTMDEVLEECLTFSLLEEQKIVIINDFKLNSESKKIEKYLENPNPNTTLILNIKNIDKRSKIYKIIKDKGHIIELGELKNNEIIEKVSSYCKKEEININYETVTYLLEKVNYDYDIALNEIDKLKIITKSIDKSYVDDYVIEISVEENFGLCDAIISRNSKKTYELFNKFLNNKEEVVPFVSLLATQYRLIYYCYNLNMTNESLGQLLNVHPYRIKLAKDKMNLYTEETIEAKLKALCELDYKLKTSNINPYILLENYLMHN